MQYYNGWKSPSMFDSFFEESPPGILKVCSFAGEDFYDREELLWKDFHDREELRWEEEWH